MLSTIYGTELHYFVLMCCSTHSISHSRLLSRMRRICKCRRWAGRTYSYVRPGLHASFSD